MTTANAACCFTFYNTIMRKPALVEAELMAGATFETLLCTVREMRR